MKQKLIALILLIFIINLLIPVFAEDIRINLVAESGIVINRDTGQVLYSKSPHQPLYPASTTKVLTAIIILEDLKLDEMVTIDDEATRAGGSHIALQPGEVVSVQDLLYALMISSANDAAVALAKHHSGTIEAFAKVMNERSKDMGAINSNFENPNGMPNEKHLTTAYDLAMIAKHAMENENFRTIVTTKRYVIDPTNKQSEKRYLNSTNSLFQGMVGSDTKIDVNGNKVLTAYEYADGIKRGYTDDAQYCFVGSATKEDRKLITVVLKSSAAAMYQDTRNLMDYGFNQTEPSVIHAKTEILKSIPMQNQKGTIVNGVLPMDIILDLPVGANIDMVKEQVTPLQTLELPITKGEQIGTVNYYFNDQMILQTKLVAEDDYVGDILLDKKIQKLNTDKWFFAKSDFWIDFSLRSFLAILLWRTIMTVIRVLSKKTKPKRTRNA